MTQPNSNAQAGQRLLSLDFMRGMIMVLLMLGYGGLYYKLEKVASGDFAHALITQFSHHPWNGLRFWDLVQPGFMFMAGTAMAYSLSRQEAQGVRWNRLLIKVLKRSGLLLFFGVGIHAVTPDGLSFELWNVLVQLAFTTLIAFLIFRWPAWKQIVFSLFLLVLTEIVYRFIYIPGFDQPFTDRHNFGNYVDLLLMNKMNDDGWVAINCIPTACHTIWGVLSGLLLLSPKPGREKIKLLLIAGLIALLSGYIMDLTITPMIKRIATSSFVLASGGWCLLILASLYWWIDIKGHKKYVWLFTVVGVNSLFVYLFINTIAVGISEYIDKITFGFLTPLRFSGASIGILSCLLTFLAEWALCWYMYKKKIFIKI
jgi:predicted acyltransferase